MTATKRTVWTSATPFDEVIIDRSKLGRLREDWSAIGKEPMNLSFRAGTFCATGSELACLRLAYYYRNESPRIVRVRFNNLCQKWVFSLDTDL